MAALLGAFALAGCAREIGGDAFRSGEVGAAVRIDRGVVESFRLVEVRDGDRPGGNPAGAIVGGASGAAIGSAIGGGVGRAIAIGTGVALGAIVGSVAQSELSRQDAFEYIVTTESGDTVAIIQSDDQPIPVGSPVFIQFANRVGGRARISPAPPPLRQAPAATS